MLVKKSSMIGYCYGVSNTIALAKKCLEEAKQKNLPCYSLGKLIHNNDVVSYFEQKGLKPIKTPQGNAPGLALVRAHGIRDCDRRAFQQAGFKLVDSTCPTVLKGVKAVRKAAAEGKFILLLGFAGHAETVGLEGVEVAEGVPAKTTLISSLEDAQKLAASNPIFQEGLLVVTQTTFPKTLYESIIFFLKEKYGDIGLGNKPCPLCEKREQEGLELASQCDCAVVVGGCESANTKNLAAVAAQSGKPVFTVENAASFDEALVKELKKYSTVALLSGSSTPISLVDEVSGLLERL
jgi:(E)-4-hydroxy-3-methyl-but-2-enyl pyrophosphate reductase